MVKRVIKRDGKIEAFEIGKIVKAISKACNDGLLIIHDEDLLYDMIRMNLFNSEEELTVEELHDVVIHCLIEHGEKEVADKSTTLETTVLEINGIESLENNTISKEESELLESYYEAMSKIDEVKQKIEDLTRKKNSLNEDIEQTEFTRKKENSLVTSKNKELKDLEIEVNRMDVKLDHLLNELNQSQKANTE